VAPGKRCHPRFSRGICGLGRGRRAVKGSHLAGQARQELALECFAPVRQTDHP
jgi:hypothetical protein